jgi:SAM-dependent methyltransferase
VTDPAALLATPGLLEAADEVAGGDPLVAAEALRARGFPADLASAALTQATLRLRAVGKFGPDAGRLLYTRDGYEQATRAVVATRRAERLAASGATHVADLGCGIGADTIAFARAGLRVTAVDADPVTAAVARANVAALGLSASVSHGLAQAVDLASVDAVFCDPARRRGGGRVFDPNSYSPPWDFVSRLVATVPRTVLKLAPGIDHGLLPAGAEAEWVSVGGDVVEACFWCGPLAEVPRRATLLPAGGPVDRAGAAGAAARSAGGAAAGAAEAAASVAAGSAARAAGGVAVLTGTGGELAPVGAVGRFVWDPDGAVVRSHLVAEFAAAVGGHLADETIAYVHADAYVPSSYGRAFEVVAVMPFSLKRLRAELRARDVGRVEIKKRGSALVPEQLRKDLRLTGSAPMTVILTRVAGAPTVLLAQPVIR